MDRDNGDNATTQPLITDQGVQHVFDAYPQTSILTRRSYVWAGSFAFLLLFSTIYVLSDANLPQKMDSETAPHAVQVSPSSMLSVREFDDSDITGFSSGRKEGFLYDLITKNKEHITNMNIPCATPWIEMTQKTYLSSDQRSVYNNLLTLAKTGTSLLNAKIESHGGEIVLLSSMPFRFKDTSNPSRVYYEQVTVKHSKGRYTSQSSEEAFCIQELYL